MPRYLVSFSAYVHVDLDDANGQEQAGELVSTMFLSLVDGAGMEPDWMPSNPVITEVTTACHVNQVDN